MTGQKAVASIDATSTMFFLFCLVIYFYFWFVQIFVYFFWFFGYLNFSLLNADLSRRDSEHFKTTVPCKRANDKRNRESYYLCITIPFFFFISEIVIVIVISFSTYTRRRRMPVGPILRFLHETPRRGAYTRAALLLLSVVQSAWENTPSTRRRRPWETPVSGVVRSGRSGTLTTMQVVADKNALVFRTGNQKKRS